jgi:hypothetical protein
MTMTTDKSIDEVQYVGVTNAKVTEAGMTTWWSLEGTVDMTKLAKAWEAEGLDPEQLPSLPPAQRTLYRAMKKFQAKRLLCRPLRGEKGYALVDETAQENDLDYAVGLRAFIEQTGTTEDGKKTFHARFEPADHKLAAAVHATFLTLSNVIPAPDFGAWLSETVRSCDAVTLRESGGIYFVPRHALGKWRAVCRAIRAATNHTVSGMPAMPADETVLAIIDAVTNEAERAAAEIDEDVEKGVGKRALETRVTNVSKVEAKLARYEEIVGQRLEAVRARLDGVRAALSTAIMTASKEEEAA